MSFQFRFLSILELRRRERDEAGAAVGQANEAIQRIDDQIESKQEERIRLRDGSQERRTGEISVDMLLTQGRYDLQMQADIQSLHDTRSQLVQELDRRQAVLVGAEAEVKRFERLQEKAETEYRALTARCEQAESDEATSRRYIIQRQR